MKKAKSNNTDLCLSQGLCFSASNGNKEAIEALLNAGNDIEQKDKDGHTALTRAVAMARTDCVAILLARGAHINERIVSLLPIIAEPGIGGLRGLEVSVIVREEMARREAAEIESAARQAPKSGKARSL